MAIKLTAADFTARTGIVEGSVVRWKTDKPDTEDTATVVLLHDTGIELEWKEIKQAQYRLEEAFRNFALVSSRAAPVSPDSPREYTWRELINTAPMATPEAARSFVLGALAYQAADGHPTPPAIVQMALRVETHKDAENLFRDLFNFSHRHINLE